MAYASRIDSGERGKSYPSTAWARTSARKSAKNFEIKLVWIRGSSMFPRRCELASFKCSLPCLNNAITAPENLHRIHLSRNPNYHELPWALAGYSDNAFCSMLSFEPNGRRVCARRCFQSRLNDPAITRSERDNTTRNFEVRGAGSGGGGGFRMGSAPKRQTLSSEPGAPSN